MVELSQRTASLGDVKEVWRLLRSVATDIPFDLGSESMQENVLTEIMACCTSGLSTIAVGEDQAVVGTLLARRDDFDWGFRNGDAVRVSYAAIASGRRNEGILRGLLAQIQERRVPLLASVKSGDQFGLAAELQELGFVQETAAQSSRGDLYRWQPSPVE